MSGGSCTPEQDAQNQIPLSKTGLAGLHSDRCLHTGPVPDAGRISSDGMQDANPKRANYGGFQSSQPTQDHVNQGIPIETIATSGSIASPIHSVFTRNQKRFIVFMAAWAGFFSPVSGNIYFPALNPLAKDLNVSNTLINLTLTSYMIFQGLAPSFFGDFADIAGRRPAYAVCFAVYIVANIGLALQNTYPALFVLRCIQSTGSSATIAMCSAVVADVTTASERGKYMGAAYSGSLLGPAIGPVIGGVLAEFLGWRAIFWFLTILGAAFMLVRTFVDFLQSRVVTDNPKARTQVGNGSIPPKGWNMSLMNYLAIRKARRIYPQGQLASPEDVGGLSQKRQKIGFPNPLRSLYIIFEKENALLLFYNAFLFAAFYDVGAAIPSQFAEIFHFNVLQIGLCYIPFGCGSVLAAFSNGLFLDRNFARWCKHLGVKIKKGRDQDLRDFPIEKVRLQIAIPAAYCTSILVCIFGWILHVDGPLPALLVILFFTSFSMSVAFNVTTTLLVDFYPKSPATASAANNLVRCLLGAGATAAVIPMIDAMGRGWTFTFLTLFLIATSPMLWVIYFRGMGWRQERLSREDSAEELKKENLRRLDDGENFVADKKPPAQGDVPETEGVAKKQPERGQQRLPSVQSNSTPDTDKRGGSQGNNDDMEERDHTISRTFSYNSGF
ncbi:uncharacterized protein A1O9_12289 [Exophiala aquamarina CBS 119918]|uniref:Major facilitator superfamily (MFS) profile domain-containing protein n=1 Tax=Exophiala aquamarina CBS 119918 TaxID=1182545 RepID=A0A072NUV0_9EURO|nr:uncharacterized protein A1O9_12289 [Exophiala aquamarina CBS 119918]KEF51654.1 hypothetical protein A1O9_12289 [Exophiala aquamarina CBS 119918]